MENKRLTKKIDDVYIVGVSVGEGGWTDAAEEKQYEANQKLGKLEDLLEKYGISDSVNFDYLEKCIQDHDKYGDLEEQLGCPLDVFLGLATHRITEIYIEYDDFSGNYASPYCTDEDIRVAYVSGIYDNNEIDGLGDPDWKIETNILTIPLSDYEEHFWLRKDKSE